MSKDRTDEIDNGGSAYPCPEDASFYHIVGMSLADKIAIDWSVRHADDSMGAVDLGAIVDFGYKLADAIIAEKRRREDT